MNSFSIDFQWLSREHGDAIERAALAEVTIHAAGQTATELEDLSAKTVRSGMRISSYLLAQWFAANWWRLRWEPERKTFSWKMSHKVGAAGNGYLWPDLTFISDGATIHVQARPSPPASMEAVRYLNNFDVVVPVADFEQGIDSFVEAVISRLDSMGAPAADLAAVWREIREERHSPDLTAWRKLEALLGFDPGEAPDQVVNGLLEAARAFGSGAIEEMAAESKEEALADIQALWDGPRQSSSLVKVPDCGALRRKVGELPVSFLPWQKATEAARLAREAWSIGRGQVTNRALSDVFSMERVVLDDAPRIAGPMNAGFRNGNPDTFGVFLKSPFPKSRRFALLRLVGDHLAASPEDRLLPATPNSRTHRQKFQRAFAQEVLCPSSELSDYIGAADPTDDWIEDAAQHFDVSPLMVKTILVNRGKVSLEKFAADIGR